MTRDTDERGKLVDHALNEWADLGCNAIQWLKNIKDGISTADEALAEMSSNYARVIALSRAALLSNAPAPSEGARHKIEYGGPPCPTCGFRIVSKPRRAPFMIEDDAPADTEDQGPDTLGERP
jgi:hypothetical protein